MKHIFYILLLTITFTGFSFETRAEETTPTSAIVEVKGMVCDFCAQSLKKVFGKKESVKEIDVNLDTQKVTVQFNESQKLTDQEIKEAIDWAGYDLVNIEYKK